MSTNHRHLIVYEAIRSPRDTNPLGSEARGLVRRRPYRAAGTTPTSPTVENCLTLTTAL